MRGPCACPAGHPSRQGEVRHENRVPTRTGTRPLPIPTSAPCPYRMVTCALPVLLVNVHHRGPTMNRGPTPTPIRVLAYNHAYTLWWQHNSTLTV
jgi:hypothetical protein